MHASSNRCEAAGDRELTLLARQLRRSDTFRFFQQAFETTTGLPLMVRPPGSFQFPLPGSKRSNSFYPLAARVSRWGAWGLEWEDHLERQADVAPVTCETFCGIFESAVPVRSGERLLAHLRTGQVFLNPPDEKQFAQVIETCGRPTSDEQLDALRRAYFQTRVIAAVRYEAAVRLLTIFAQHLAIVANQLLIRARGSELPAIAKARVFLEQNLTEQIRLEDAARAAGLSGIYFCKLFHQLTGDTFTRYLAKRRVELAKEALTRLDTRICEVAYATGFQSLSQFNRVFRHVAGESPSSYRAHVHHRG